MKISVDIKVKIKHPPIYLHTFLHSYLHTKNLVIPGFVQSVKMVKIKTEYLRIDIFQSLKKAVLNDKRTKPSKSLSVKRLNSSTPNTSSTLSADSEGLSGVHDGVVSGDDKNAADLYTPPYTPEKACIYEHGVDENGALVDSWFSIVEDCSEEDLPPEFWKPAPPVHHPQTSEQMSLK